jgi:hypothetical protein
MVYTEIPSCSEIIDKILHDPEHYNLVEKCWIYSKRKELSHLSPRVREKLAEISLKLEPPNNEPTLDKKGNPTGSYHMRSEREIAAEKLDTLRKKLPTCFKDLARYLI